MTQRTGEVLLLVFALAALAGVCFTLVPPGLSSNEEGVLFVQMKNFALNGSLEITGPGQQLGFSPADAAGQDGLFEARDGRLYAITPPLFPWVASLFYPLLGDRAVDFTPILFVFLSALVVGLILDRVMQRGLLYYSLLAAFLFGSPVFLQGLLFFGMAFALFLVVSALWLLVSHLVEKPSMAKLFVASVLMGASVLVRLECLLIALSFYGCAAVVFFAQRRMKDLWTMLAGVAFCLGVFILHDVVLHGRFPGPYLQMFLPYYTLSPIRCAALGGALAASAVMIVVSGRERTGPVWKAILSILAFVVAVSAILLTAAHITVLHLVALFPAVLFVFYAAPGRVKRLKKGGGTLEGILAGTVVLCLILGAVILHPRDWIVYSAWLPTVPFVVLLLAFEREHIFARGRMYIVLAFFCSVSLVNGIQDSNDHFLKYKDFNAARIALLEKHTSAGDAILFDNTGSMEHAGPLFLERVFLIADSPGDQERLGRMLFEKGIEKAYVWTTNPRTVKGYNSYSEQAAAAFPSLRGTKSRCSGSCGERNFYLVRMNTREMTAAGTKQGGGSRS